MREIEFRLFSKKDNLMFNCYELIFVQGGIRASNGCTHIGWVKVNKEFEHKLEEELVLMQYSGLKDKNGVKIFEGDILKCQDPMDEYYTTTVSNDGAFTVDAKGCDYDETSLIYAYGQSDDIVECEVIGNIYNKEEQ